ncbi:MAG TPA: DUF1501 domain-containing protein [Bryobacteraceae bacterium]|nr:DUF1501 domain-containing protein [Bryobacteraceae bacterium]
MSYEEGAYEPLKPRNDKAEEFARKYPHHHQTFFNRPHWTRRRFFEIAGAGLVGSYLAQKAPAAGIETSQGMPTKNTAKNCIFILLTGAISTVDTFDLKVTNGVTPSNFNPTMVNGVNWPMGLLPKLGAQLGNVALVRSMRAWALVHSLAQTWTQIGRNPAAALGDIAPNIGSVVAIEKDIQRQAGQVFPTFVALNSPSGAGPGYFPATYAPFRVNEASGTTSAGVPNVTNPNGQSTFNTMYQRLHQLDDSLRINSPYGTPLEDYNAFYQAAQGMMYNSAVNQAFGFSAADSMRYGSSQFGNACLAAKQILASNQGTRFVQISYGSWDMHVDIYGQQNPKGSNLYTMCPALDNGVSALLTDLKSSGLLDETLVVMVGEFGRTPQITEALGRDHYVIQSILFAGAGVKGGKVIGATLPDGSDVADYGWNGYGGSGPRYVRPEDVEATIYSAMGIDWTTIRNDDPYHRGFEYVPFASQGTYGPINELWS